MKNKEFYQRTFSRVHSTANISYDALARPRRRAGRFLVAAVVAALIVALCGTVAAVKLLGLRDLAVPDALPPYFTPSTADKPITFISLSGYIDSSETRALVEWQDFCRRYDPDGEILRAVGNYIDPALMEYLCYTVYTPEMAEELERIAAKYELKLHTMRYDLCAQPELVAHCAGYEGQTVAQASYMFEDGSFHAEGWANLPDFGALDYQLQRSVRGTMHDILLNIGDAADYEEWSYRSACSVEVLLALGPNKAVILADLGESLVAVNILCGRDTGLRNSDVETLADMLNFSKLKTVVAPAAPEQTDGLASDALTPEQMEARRIYAVTLSNFYYGEYLPDGTEAETNTAQFVLADVNGDGVEELILLCEGTYTASYQGYVIAAVPDAPPDCIRIELLEYPWFDFLDTGFVMAMSSHNQGLAGDELWPYTLYRYDAEERIYQPVAYVDAWSRALGETDYAGNPYPAEVDAEGYGAVYYVTTLDENRMALSAQTLSHSEYERWLAETTQGGEIIPIDYFALTPEAIASLG